LSEGERALEEKERETGCRHRARDSSTPLPPPPPRALVRARAARASGALAPSTRPPSPRAPLSRPADAAPGAHTTHRTRPNPRSRPRSPPARRRPPAARGCGIDRPDGTASTDLSRRTPLRDRSDPSAPAAGADSHGRVWRLIPHGRMVRRSTKPNPRRTPRRCRGCSPRPRPGRCGRSRSRASASARERERREGRGPGESGFGNTTSVARGRAAGRAKTRGNGPFARGRGVVSEPRARVRPTTGGKASRCLELELGREPLLVVVPAQRHELLAQRDRLEEQ
jgi:serine/arginine repetitive matrix protein 2